jgi:SNF2 family DNA or RNA helicase
MIIKKKCNYCHKTTDITSEIPLDNGTMLVFACGHSTIEIKLAAFQFDKPEYCEVHEIMCIKTFTSNSGKHLFPYQAAGIDHILASNCKDLCADEMGLGKTVQALIPLLINKELRPVIIVCKSIATGNWMWEILDWLSTVPQIIQTTKDMPHELFPIHILSYDMFSRLDTKLGLTKRDTNYKCTECDRVTKANTPKCTRKWQKECNKCDVPHMHVYTCTGLMEEQIFKAVTQSDKLKEAWLKILDRCQTLIIDETHLIKNPEATRSKALKRLSSNVPHIIGLSGTPIKNNATEFFTIFNILKPEKFYRFKQFCWNHVNYEYVQTALGWTNKFTGLKDPETFKEMTQDYMFRRTVDEAAPDLPKLFKTQQYVELDKEFKEIYEASEKAFIEWFESADSSDIQNNLLAQLAMLRHQTSLSKIDFTIDLIMQFLGSSESDKKIAIFTHHLDARDILAERLTGVMKQLDLEPPLILVKGSGVDEEIDKFKAGNSRVLLLSTLAHGESINLQFIADSILHERQWNPSNEDQAISGRFRRIGQEAKKIRCSIPVALGTIDEYFVELVERKRRLTEEALSGVSQEGSWNQTGFVAELTDMIVQRGREKWKM